MSDQNFSRIFSKWIVITGLAWLGMGSLLFYSSTEDLWTFLKAFLFSFLDLSLILLIFWKVIFVRPEDQTHPRSRIGQILLFIFFKLVCLVFLAIILKRLRNASIIAVALGIGFIGMGPLIAGVIARRRVYGKTATSGNVASSKG